MREIFTLANLEDLEDDLKEYATTFKGTFSDGKKNGVKNAPVIKEADFEDYFTQVLDSRLRRDVCQSLIAEAYIHFKQTKTKYITHLKLNLTLP